VRGGKAKEEGKENGTLINEERKAKNWNANKR